MKLTKLLNEIQINSPGNKPYSKYKQFIDEIFNRKFIENIAEPDSFDPVEILTSNGEGIENAFTTFILNHMVRNNYEIDGQIVSHNSQIDESDTIKYVKSKPKLKQALAKLIYKFYLEKVSEIKVEFKKALIKVTNESHPDSYQPGLNKYEVEQEVTWDMHKLEEEYFIDYVYDIINYYDQEFEQYLLNVFGLKSLNEAEYHGRTVQLNKPMQGDSKKFKVYIKNAKGKVVKVNFGFGGSSAKGKRMNIKKNNPTRRKAYRARHHCDNPGPKWKANYWSCRKW